MTIIKAITYWLIFFAAIAVLWSSCTIQWRWKPALFELPTLSGGWVLFFGVSLAFVWVEILKWGVAKPFTCLKCMAGWITFLLALLFHAPAPYLYLPAGLFIGAILTGIKMRWL